ncbi:site-2 protease family protein [Patescibacteria group bacterium]|nr:site-2 protease family protein [Patescibacteria group bacterium]
MVTILIFILILSILVVVHEAGHFFVAKILKIKVEEFGFGLPPKAFSIKRGETVYSLNWLPIGGFVRLYGEDEAGSGKVKVKSEKPKIKDIGRAFFARPAWQRAIVIVAGVVMNFVLAVVIISYLFSAVGVPVPGNKVLVGDVVKNSPAYMAGLKKNDQVIAINNVEMKTAAEVVLETRKHLGEKISITIKDSNSNVRKIEVTPRKNFPKTEGPMGVAVGQNIEVKKYAWYLAPFLGTMEALGQSWMILSGLGIILYQLLFFGAVPGGVAGPVGIAQLTGQFVQVGIYAVLSFVALLSLNLAILNILPFPALDGGRLFFIVIEILTGKKVNQRFESYAHAIGMVVLLGLIALVTLHDIFRLATGQPILPQIQ